jgi:hypothetical protein
MPSETPSVAHCRAMLEAIEIIQLVTHTSRCVAHALRGCNSYVALASRAHPHTPYVRNRPLRGGLHIAGALVLGSSRPAAAPSSAPLYFRNRVVAARAVVAAPWPLLSGGVSPCPCPSDNQSVGRSVEMPDVFCKSCVS